MEGINIIVMGRIFYESNTFPLINKKEFISALPITPVIR